MIHRRGLLLNLAGALAAPAIVPYANLMPVRVIPTPVRVIPTNVSPYLTFPAFAASSHYRTHPGPTKHTCDYSSVEEWLWPELRNGKATTSTLWTWKRRAFPEYVNHPSTWGKWRPLAGYDKHGNYIVDLCWVHPGKRCEGYLSLPPEVKLVDKVPSNYTIQVDY